MSVMKNIRIMGFFLEDPSGYPVMRSQEIKEEIK